MTDAPPPAGPPTARPPAGDSTTAAGSVWRNALLQALVLALALGLLAALWILAHPLMLLLAAVVIATALAPAVTWLERWLPRTLAVLAVYLVVVLVIGGAGWLVVPGLVEQARALIVNGPGLVERGGEWLDRWDPLPFGEDEVAGNIRSIVDRFGSLVVSLPLTILSSVTELVLVLVMSIYLLLAAPGMKSFLLSLFPRTRRDDADAVVGEITSTMGGYVRAEALVGLIIGLLSYVGLRVIGVEYPLVLAVIAGLGELIPVAGPIIAAVPALAVALIDSPTQAAIVLVFYIVLQQVESNILLPNIMRKQTDIPPPLTLFALSAGAAVGGLLGALLAIPLAGALRVLVLRVLAPAVRRWSGAEADQG